VEAKIMGKLVMNKDLSEVYNIESDKNIRDSGIQGGKIIGVNDKPVYRYFKGILRLV
jgi:hypothetical protein